VIASASPDYHVIIASRSLENGNAARSEIEAGGIKGTLSTLQLDVTDEQSIDAAAKQVEKDFGRVDVLINNAGIASQDPNLKKQYEATLTTNVIGPVLVTAAFEPLLLKSKRPYLLHVGSGLGSIGLAVQPISSGPSIVTYSVSKTALNMVTVQHARTLGKHGVKVFVLCPGLVRSHLRGKAEEQISVGGRAGDPTASGEFFLSVIEGKRDADVGKFIHKDGVYPW
jgi:NAD(P)-dependent dehydrogenase (short-subunit alcohol dehydrogenase family)